MISFGTRSKYLYFPFLSFLLFWVWFTHYKDTVSVPTAAPADVGFDLLKVGPPAVRAAQFIFDFDRITTQPVRPGGHT